MDVTSPHGSSSNLLGKRAQNKSPRPSFDAYFGNIPNLTESVKLISISPIASDGYSVVLSGYGNFEGSTVDVSIKVIHTDNREFLSTTRAKECISQEITMWYSAKHKNIVPLYGLYWRSGYDVYTLPCLVHPHYPAGTCTDFLTANPGFDRMKILHQVADGLSYLHNLPIPIRHGDIKARNLLMEENGTPVLVNFGLGPIINRNQFGVHKASRSSYRWMAPELLREMDSWFTSTMTTASDIWAFGCLCLEILTGALPWGLMEDERDIIKAALDRRQPPLSSALESSVVGHILKHCWTYSPDDRPPMLQLSSSLRLNDETLLHNPSCVLESRFDVPSPRLLPYTINPMDLGTSSPTLDILPVSGHSPLQEISSLNQSFKKDSITISSNMQASEIVAHLVANSCPDVTGKLDLARCGSVPIAGGGFGDIYQGVLLGGAKVAIKCPRLYLKHDETGRKVLKNVARELYAWSSLKHPNVLQLIGLSTFRDQISMVSPWMENGSLPEYISRNPGVNRFQLCAQVSAGLAHLHEMETVHGDIKGLNVLVSETGIAKLTDFGNTIIQKCTLEFTGTTSGSKVSVRWTAPEVLEGKNMYTKEADVYALGMTFLEIITGKVPYSDKVDQAVLVTVIVTRKPPGRPKQLESMDERRAELLWKIMSQCWAYEPVDRPSALEIECHLDEIEKNQAWLSHRGTFISSTGTAYYTPE